MNATMRRFSRAAMLNCALALVLLDWSGAAQAASPIPALRKQGSATQLMVDQQPFLVLGGELHNSSASSLAYLEKQWPALKAAEINTVLAPVEWDQLEPVEGRFDFTLLDGLLQQARAHHTRLILLWFGAWKNSMSTYAPSWVKLDQQRFPRARNRAGLPQDLLSPFERRTLAADTAAYCAMLAHLKQADPQRTVLMVQVENEIGMLPDVRDYGPLANAAYAGPVPPALMAYLRAHLDAPQDGLHAALRALWAAHGKRMTGSWSEVFGDSMQTEEIFQAWHYATFVEAMTAAGKAIYPLPMFVNVALNRPGKKPGEYPSAGPLPHLFDVWKAGAPSIDLLAIDTYFPNFADWARLFKRPDNPLFIPEANYAGRPNNGANAFYMIGEHDAFGFSPFGIEDIKDGNTESLPRAYRVLRQLTPLINRYQGSGNMRGLKAAVSYDGVVDLNPVQLSMGGYLLDVSFVNQWGKTDPAEVETRGGLVIRLADDEFLVAGKGVTVTFKDADITSGAMVGIEKLTEGSYHDGVWQEGRWLNGDESHQGRHLRLPAEDFSIQRIKLYRYR